MEQPLDGNDTVDVEGFAEIIVGEEHAAIMKRLDERLQDAFTQAAQLRDRFLPFRYVRVRVRVHMNMGGCERVLLRL